LVDEVHPYYNVQTTSGSSHSGKYFLAVYQPFSSHSPRQYLATATKFQRARKLGRIGDGKNMKPCKPLRQIMMLMGMKSTWWEVPFWECLFSAPGLRRHYLINTCLLQRLGTS